MKAKMMNDREPPPQPVAYGFTGRAERASYERGLDIVAYKGNPLIEALGPIMSPVEVGQRLQRRPPFDKQHRDRPLQERFQLIWLAQQFFAPTRAILTLQQH